MFVLALAVAVEPARQPGGLGRISFPTSGPVTAQPAFLRGVALLHNFEYDEAIAAFREAQHGAPDFAMAFWGEAMCYNQPLWRHENLAQARAVLARLGPTPAVRSAKAATARERGYLDAVERLFGEGDKTARDRAYASRMAALAAEHPADDEAALFSALAMLATIPEGTRNTQLSLKAGAIAAAILKKNPQHPGAAHYALHAYDDGENNRLGLEAARIYAKIAPASSHALHMPSHVFLPLGLWDEAVASDEASFAASQAWVKGTGRSAAQLDFHSLSWLHYEYLQQGRFAKARETADVVTRAAAAPQAPAGAAHHVESEIGRGYGPMSLKSELASMRARYVVETRDWSRMKGQSTFDNLDELFALGLSSVALGDQARATTALEHLRKAGAAPGNAADGAVIATIMADELAGVQLFARGDRVAALAALARAADAEARRPRPIARPHPIKPAAELYGEFLLASGDARGAMAQFKASLSRTPRRAASLFGLAAASAGAGARAESADAAREFLKVWHRADSGRPEIADAKRWLEAR